MKNYKIFFLVIIKGCIIGCSKNAKKQMLEVTDKISNQIETISESTIETVKQYKKTIVDQITAEEIPAENTTTLNDSVVKPEIENDKFLGIASFKNFISNCKTGETLTQKELIENHDVPADGIKLIKSITKTAEDEIEIKWKSTWFIEKISDAKFRDAKIKFKFETNKMYTSGNAIGIKYKKKIYTDLIIIGTKAYIPSVKGYHWKIGK